MPPKAKFTEEQTQAIVDMFKDGKAIKEISRDMGTTPITIKRYLKNAGAYKRRKAGAAIKPGKAKAAKTAKVTKVTKTAKAPKAAKVSDGRPDTLAGIIRQLKQTEEEIAGLQKALAQAVECQAKTFEQLKQAVNI